MNDSTSAEAPKPGSAAPATADEFKAITGVENSSTNPPLGVAIAPEVLEAHRKAENTSSVQTPQSKPAESPVLNPMGEGMRNPFAQAVSLEVPVGNSPKQNVAAAEVPAAAPVLASPEPAAAAVSATPVGIEQNTSGLVFPPAAPGAENVAPPLGGSPRVPRLPENPVQSPTFVPPSRPETTGVSVPGQVTEAPVPATTQFPALPEVSTDLPQFTPTPRPVPVTEVAPTFVSSVEPTPAAPPIVNAPNAVAADTAFKQAIAGAVGQESATQTVQPHFQASTPDLISQGAQAFNFPPAAQEAQTKKGFSLKIPNPLKLFKRNKA